MTFRQATLTSRIWKYRWAYVFILPTMILYAMYTLWPIGASWYYSLLAWSGFEASGRFIGLENYRDLVQDPLFWNAFRNTFVFMGTAMPLRVGLALAFALALNRGVLPAKGMFRTLLFLPVVTTAAIVGIVMKLVLDPSGGPLNAALQTFGLVEQPIRFLGLASTAMASAIGVWVWKWLGITLIYWLAALQTIPEELYEAATIDGAGRIKTFRFVTLPLLTPFTIIIMLITAVDAMNVFELMLTLTGGGPFFATEVIEIYIYRWAFAATVPRLGYASSAAVFFGLVFSALTIAQVLTVRFLRGKGATS